MQQQYQGPLPESVLVVDDDQLITALAKKMLQEMDIQRVDCFASGEDAWEALSKHKYDFICLDWKLPGLSGLALFNRLRTSRTYASTPILVISGFLQKEDFKILSEYSCSALVEKPFAKPQFEHHFYKLLELKEWRKRADAGLREVMADFDRDPKKSMKQLRALIEASPDPIMQVVQAARAMRAKRLYQDAEMILRQALEKDPQSVTALTELGKVLHLTKRHKDAARALQAANYMSSDNLERLLLMGEVKLHDLDPNEAKKHFESALGIDPDSPKAKAGILSADNIETYATEPGVGAAPKSFASLLNIIAISKVRSGKMAEGVAQYKAALSFLHENKTVARVFFNLGLAYLRNNNEDVAKDWFRKSAETGGKLFDKAAHYVRQLEERSLDRNNVLSYGQGQKAGPVPTSSATPVELMDCSDGDGQPSNVEFMEEADILEGDLQITEAVGDEDDASEMEDAVAYI